MDGAATLTALALRLNFLNAPKLVVSDTSRWIQQFCAWAATSPHPVWDDAHMLNAVETMPGCPPVPRELIPDAVGPVTYSVWRTYPNATDSDKIRIWVTFKASTDRLYSSVADNSFFHGALSEEVTSELSREDFLTTAEIERPTKNLYRMYPIIVPPFAHQSDDSGSGCSAQNAMQVSILGWYYNWVHTV